VLVAADHEELLVADLAVVVIVEIEETAEEIEEAEVATEVGLVLKADLDGNVHRDRQIGWLRPLVQALVPMLVLSDHQSESRADHVTKAGLANIIANILGTVLHVDLVKASVDIIVKIIRVSAAVIGSKPEIKMAKSAAQNHALVNVHSPDPNMRAAKLELDRRLNIANLTSRARVRNAILVAVRRPPQ